jgi:predicted phosphate transport protein (TIGR00153 family)
MAARHMATKEKRGLWRRLLPSTGGEQFFELFERHAERAQEAASLLLAQVQEGADVPKLAERVKDVEHQGDEITHAVMERLHQTFITPLDRDDIHRLMSRMDDVLDLIWASSERLWLYDVKLIEPEVKQLAEVLLRGVEEMKHAIGELRDLSDRQKVVRHCTEINRLENEGDSILRRAVARLFRESAADPIHVIKTKEIYDNLENAIDRTEDVANVLEGVALEYS